MDRTTIQCPSCNREVCIALSPPLCSRIPLGLKALDFPLDSLNKEHSLRDILCVHEVLIEDNKYLREIIQELVNKLKHVVTERHLND